MGNWIAKIFGMGSSSHGGSLPMADLPALGADPDTLSVIGFSGGSWMGSLMHVIHSDTIKGSGLMNGAGYSYGFTKPLPDDMLSQTIGIADGFSGNEIDDTSNLNGAPVYIISGQQDEAVDPSLQEAQRDFFQNYNAEISYHSLDLGHWITWDGCYNALQHIYSNIAGSGITNGSPLTTGETDDSTWQDNGYLLKFDQSEFSDDMQAANLKDHGLMYVPQHCAQNSGCKVFFGLHGCGMGAGGYITNELGYVQPASWNNIILVLPQAQEACFSVDVDEAGDSNYNNKDGHQIKAVKAMMDRVLSTHDGAFDWDSVDVMDTYNSAEDKDGYSEDKDGSGGFDIWDWLLSLLGLGGDDKGDDKGDWEEGDDKEDWEWGDKDDYEGDEEKSDWGDWDGDWGDWDEEDKD